MNGYDQRSLAFMKEARRVKKMPESALVKPSRPRDTVGPDMTEAISADDLEMLFQIFKPRGKDEWGGEWDHGPSGDADMCEAPLNTKRRNALPASDFALPGRRYPIDTPARARAALSRVVQFGSPEEIRRVRAAVKRKYPNMDVETPTRRGRRD
jgi:hypothetical protein